MIFYDLQKRKTVFLRYFSESHEYLHSPINYVFIFMYFINHISIVDCLRRDYKFLYIRQKIQPGSKIRRSLLIKTANA